MRATAALLFVSLALLVPGLLPAATPVNLVNYQGVLRGADDKPKNGTFDMGFSFHPSDVSTETILIDDHAGLYGSAVVVTDGLFNVALGAGHVSDGGGPGTYTSLSDVFRDFGAVWMSVTVSGETLAPRVRILAAPYCENAHSLDGVEGSGYSLAGHGHSGSEVSGTVSDSDMLDSRHASEFLDTSSGFQSKMGSLKLTATTTSPALEVIGETSGKFTNKISGASTYLASINNIGIEASGSNCGGWFRDTDATSEARMACASIGVLGEGTDYGGHFQDIDGTGVAMVGYGNTGIDARGSVSGGYFADLDGSGSAEVGVGDRGIRASGNASGAYLRDLDSGAFSYVGYGLYGIWSEGDEAGGYFKDKGNSGYAHIGYDTFGIAAHGTSAGGYFQDDDGSGAAWLAWDHRGIWAKGTFAGGTFSHPDDTTFWADVSTPTYKILGTGAVSFAQNDPGRDDRVIVYAAPEGDEVAVYTRGKARLSGGEARIDLGETFRLVANPDLGLTAYLTPIGTWSDLYVASQSTRELIVRARPGSPDVTFNYIVWGLRLGFEDLAIVQPKRREALPPTAQAIAASYGDRPEFREHSALSRHRAMSLAVGDGEPELSGTRALVDALERQRASARSSGPERPPESSPSTVEPEMPAAPPAAPERAVPPAELPANLFPVIGPVEAGDVLALDPLVPGLLRRSGSPADPMVVGVAAGAPVEVDGTPKVALVETNVATVKADATPGAIVPGDLLVSSPLAGHAMKSAAPAPGTVLGKAMDPLDAGTGTIRILVIPR